MTMGTESKTNINRLIPNGRFDAKYQITVPVDRGGIPA
jgi:hypothetical protein